MKGKQKLFTLLINNSVIKGLSSLLNNIICSVFTFEIKRAISFRY